MKWKYNEVIGGHGKTVGVQVYQEVSTIEEFSARTATNLTFSLQ
jgi:hypothetical protein